MRTFRRDYGNIGTFHLFMAAPAGFAVLVGQLLNTFGGVQTCEHVSNDGSGSYKPAALLRPAPERSSSARRAVLNNVSLVFV
jgi:hypothetical protein